MSTVNLAETLILIRDRQPSHFEAIHDEILSLGIEFVPPTQRDADEVARARLAFPLNFGDCFAYVLARGGRGPVLTLDRKFQRTDAAVICPV